MVCLCGLCAYDTLQLTILLGYCRTAWAGTLRRYRRAWSSSFGTFFGGRSLIVRTETAATDRTEMAGRGDEGKNYRHIKVGQDPVLRKNSDVWTPPLCG